MTSIGNKSKLATSEICQRCAKCCKEFTVEEGIDMALRFKWMFDKRIIAEDTPFNFADGWNVKKVTFKIGCIQLRQDKDGKSYCKVWDKERPDFCCRYPDNVFNSVEKWNREKIQKIIDETKKDCPIFETITVDEVIKKLWGEEHDILTRSKERGIW
jgi:hypothetical protein